jgi:hypothetical protein
LCLTIASAAVTAPSVAHATSPHGAKVEIDISAQLVGRCGIETVGPRTNEGDRLDRDTTVVFAFELDCSTPFRIGLAAQHGALRLAGAAAGAPSLDGFAIRKPYDVGLRFKTDQVGMQDAGSCASESLTASSPSCRFYAARAGEGFSPGEDVTAIQQPGTLQVSWSGEEPGGARLAAGNYEDTITIVVGPRT